MLLFLLAISVAGIVPSLLIYPFVHGRTILGNGLDALNALAEVIAALLATWFMITRIDRRSWSDLGLGPSAAQPGWIVGGFLIGGAAIAAAILGLIAVGWLRLEHLPAIAIGHPILDVTALLIPAALAEELIARGYLLSTLRDAVNWRFAVVVTSLGFGALHAANPGANAQSILLVTIAGVFLACVRIATRSLYAAWSAHFAWNWVMAVLFHAPVSGIAFQTSGYRYVDAGPNWATGGGWGPEGGAFAGATMLVGIVLLWNQKKAD